MDVMSEILNDNDIIIGGRIEEMTMILREAHIDVLTNELCIETMPDEINEILDSHVCVKDLETEDKGACNVS